jgi:hypothetical protein
VLGKHAPTCAALVGAALAEPGGDRELASLSVRCDDENYGDEAVPYLRFLVEHYDDALPELAVFVHGDPFNHSPHLNDMLDCLRDRTQWAGGYFSLSKNWFDIKKPEYMDVFEPLRVALNGALAARGFGPERHIPAFDAGVTFYCCAQFVVARDAVRRHSRLFYETLLETTLRVRRPATAPGAVQGSVLHDRKWPASFFEHVWHEVFGEPRVMPWLEFADHCADAGAAGPAAAAVAAAARTNRSRAAAPLKLAAPFSLACCNDRPALLGHLTGKVTTWTLYERETSKFRGPFFWEPPPSATSAPAAAP